MQFTFLFVPSLKTTRGMYTIENETLRISVNPKGAELNSIYSKETQLEYLWEADPAFWNKQSPVLFPIVGALKGNQYRFNNRTYHLARHGFARDREFSCIAHDNTSVSFSLESDEKTMEVYPFLFRFEIIYTVIENELQVKYLVTNTGQTYMYFSVGGHPAFRLPLEKGLAYEDYYFEFEQVENARRWLISREGLIEPAAIPFILNDRILPISKDLFSNDAIVFKHLNSDKVRIKTKKSVHGLEFAFPGFPYLGLWAAPQADFVCIEPWCGIADSTLSNQDFINKEGIQLLTDGQAFERTWSVKFY